jgi:superfamily II DNA/RNA helicase
VTRIQATGFEKPTPIQSVSWPVLIQEPLRDVISIAKTGSGKTCAFLIPAFRRIHQWRNANRGLVQPNAGPLVLILAPTRELAVQIHLECVKFGGGQGKAGGTGDGNTGGAAYKAPSDVYVPGDSSDEEELAESNRQAAGVGVAEPGTGDWLPVSSACVYGGTASQASLLQVSVCPRENECPRLYL